MVAILLLVLLLLAPVAEAHQLSQLEEIPHQIQPITSLVGYPALSMENISWHTSSSRRVAYEPDSPQGNRDFDVRTPVRVHNLEVSAYTSRARETDSTPFITATGERVRWGIVASNKFPLGTQLRLPDLFGPEIFVVEDCMNERYKHRIDVWMSNLRPAIKFGVKKMVRIEVVEYGKRRKCYS